MYENILENGLVRLRVIPSVSYVLRGIENKMYLLFELTTDKKETEVKRKPFDLSVVLDRSGSMHGPKLERSKEAIELLINNLRTEDGVSLTVYDNQVGVVFKNQSTKNKSVLLQNIRSIHSGGSTFLSGGLEQGAELLKKSSHQDRRVFIFSDGLANVGIRDIDGVSRLAQQIRAEGIKTSSFGIGDNFSEDMMVSISESGGGEFYFIESASDIPVIVEDAIEGMLANVLLNVRLQLREALDVQIKKVFGFDSTTIDVGDIKSEETRQFLVEINITPGQSDSIDVLQFKLDYSKPENLKEIGSLSDIVKIKITDDESLISEENPEVMQLKEMLESAERETDMIELIDQGRYDDSIRMYEREIDKLEMIENKDPHLIDKIDLMKDNLTQLRLDKERDDYRMSRKKIHYDSYSTARSLRRHSSRRGERLRETSEPSAQNQERRSPEKNNVTRKRSKGGSKRTQKESPEEGQKRRSVRKNKAEHGAGSGKDAKKRHYKEGKRV